MFYYIYVNKIILYLKVNMFQKPNSHFVSVLFSRKSLIYFYIIKRLIHFYKLDTIYFKMIYNMISLSPKHNKLKNFKIERLTR